MAVEVIKDGGAGQSFATWLLWAALDTILTISLFLQREIISCRSVCRRRHRPNDTVAGQRTIRLEPHGQRDFGARVWLFDRLETGGAKTATVAATLGIALQESPA